MSRMKSLDSYIASIKKMLDLWALSEAPEKKKILSSLLTIQESINEMLFGTKYFSASGYSHKELDEALSIGDTFFEGYSSWLDFATETALKMDSMPNSVDASFCGLISYIEVSSEESLLMDMVNNFSEIPDDTKSFTLRFYNNLSYMWGTLDLENGDYSVFNDRIHMLKTRLADFTALYERLADYRSKNVLFHTLAHWISFKNTHLLCIKEANFPDYCDLDLIPETTDTEVFVDCGAYDGDSALGFIKAYGKYKKIICYEASQKNFEKLTDALKDYDNTDLRRKAVGEDFSEMTISDMEDGSSLFAGTGEAVKVVPIDSDIAEPISFVKMDIEGAEQSAIRGMSSHIKNDRPKLLISVYHGNRDLVEIPLLIDSIRDDYKFYLRYNGPLQLNIPSDIVLYAI